MGPYDPHTETQIQHMSQGTDTQLSDITRTLTHDNLTTPDETPNQLPTRGTTQDWKGRQQTEHSNSTFTIGFSNINGIGGEQNQSLQSNLHDIAATQHHYAISLLCLSEHHIAMNNPKTKQKIHELERYLHKTLHTKFYLHSSQETTTHNRRLMGGTGIIASKQTIGRINPNESGGDPLGRWTYVTLRNTNRRPITVVSIYQVCHNPTNKLGSTAWHQQRRALDGQQRTSEHPRDAFMNDLTKLLRQLKDNDHDIIVGGDWNEPITTAGSKTLKLSIALGLTDPWIHYYPEHDDFATHERGSQRIDYVLVSHSLLPLIRYVSYSPVGMIQNNDHRTLLVHLDTNKLFGYQIRTILKYHDRHVRSNDKKSVTTFVEAMYDHLYSNSAFTRSLPLKEGHITSADLAENIDSLIGQAGEHAEKRCTRRRPEWFSVKLTNQRLKVSYIHYYAQGIRKSIDRRSIVLSKLEMIGATVDLPTTENDTLQLLLEERNILKEMQHNCRTLRTAELVTSDSTPGKRINKHEAALATWKTLSYLKQTSTMTTIDYLDVPSDWPPPFSPLHDILQLSDPKQTLSWKRITLSEEIEYYLQLRNRLHFGQAQGTPFTIAPLSHDVPWEGNSQSTDDILLGQYIPSADVPHLCREVLLACQKRDHEPIVQSNLTYEVFRGKMRKWRETTATSPSGRHLGRYKALFNKGLYNEGDDEYETFTTKQQEIATLILRLINFCISSGHVLTRWLTVVNTMICKDPGVFKIHRLRILHLYEADFNLILGVKWRELIMKADQKGWVNNKQHGARPGCEATTLALYEEVRTDIAYSTRRTLATIDNDMDSCFDRMLPSLISLNNRSFGLPDDLTFLHGRSLKTIQYHLRSNNGISNSHYTHTDDFPIYGTGQGSGNSPVLWLLMSSTLFDVYDYHAHGATVEDPSGTIKLKMTINGFVDDTNSCINKWYPNKDCSRADLTSLIQHDAQLWTELVNISGGKLELTKCSLHTLSFDFATDGTPRINHQIPPTVNLLDPITNKTFQLSTLNPTQPHKTLGHWKAPAGNSSKQLQTIQAKIKLLNIRIATSSVSRYGARLGYHAIIVASLRYVLPQCHFKRKTLRNAEKSGMANLIAKCGFSSRTAHALLYAPKEYGGGGFLHWDIIQGEGQIMLFLKHWRTTSDLSTALQIDLAWCQWQAGTSTSILTDTHIPLPHLEARWIPSLRSALKQFQATFLLDKTFVVPKERLDDKYLMDIALSQPHYTPTDIKIVNYCRLYLHVTTVSELLDPTGVNFLPHVLRCERPPWFDHSLNITIQSRPSHQQIKKRWLPFCALIKREHTTEGPWVQGHSLRLRRQCYAVQSNPIVIYYWHKHSYWKCSAPATIGAHHKLIQLQEPVSWTPSAHEHMEPIHTIARIHHTIYLRTNSQYLPDNPRLPHTQLTATDANPHQSPCHHSEDPMFVQYIGSVSRAYQKFLRNVQWTTNATDSASAICHIPADAALLIVTDGSSLEGIRMSYGGVIGTDTGTILAKFSGDAPGHPSSFRAEATGVLAGAMILTHLALYTKIDLHGLAVTACCDNSSVIKRMTDRSSYEKVYPNSTLRPDWDVTEEAHHCYNDLSLKQLKFEWVRGHQDDTNSTLTTQSHFNVMADALARAVAPQTDGRDTNNTMLQETRCLLSVKGQILHGNYRSILRRSGTETDLYEYLSTKHGWDRQIWDDVDWGAFHMAARTYPASEVHLLKLVHDQLPFRKHTARFQPWTPNHCHYCEDPDTMDHLQCAECNPISGPFRTQLKKRLTILLDSRGCSKKFQYMLLAAVQFWLTADLPDTLALSIIFARQNNIGWRLLTRGFMTRSWRQLLEDTTLLGDPTQPSRQQMTSAESIPIMAGIIKLLWTSLSELWLLHLQHIHKASEPTGSPITKQELHTKVRWMHTFQTQLAQTHPHYFRDDLEEFLTNASTTALMDYISQYANAIQTALDHLLPNDSQDTPPAELLHDYQEPTHRKRNRRRKVMTGITHSLRKWFNPKPP